MLLMKEKYYLLFNKTINYKQICLKAALLTRDLIPKTD